MLCAPDIDSKVQAFNEIIIGVYDKFAPLTPTRVKYLPAPWLTADIKALMARRDKARIKLRHADTDANRNLYLSLRKRCSKLCRSAKRKYIHSQIENCPPKKLWTFLRSIGVGKSQCSDAAGVDCEELNKHFCAPPVSVDPTVKQSTLASLESSHFDFPPLDFDEISVDKVLKLLKSVRSRAVGHDGIGMDMLSPICHQIAPFLAHILNFSLSSGTFPSIWKAANVIPLPKKPNPTSLSQFRPISILPVLSKILEQFVNESLTNHLARNNLLNPMQSGFRPGHSTVSALVKITDDIRLNIENKMLTVLVLLDFSSAFNTVDLDILLAVLKSMNLSPTVISWFHSYLSCRQQRIVSDDMVSDWCVLTSGVPQGGILSPILFSVFINGISSSLDSNHHLYADDLQIYLATHFDSFSDAICKINDDLSRISCWTKAHGLLVNASKSQAIIIGSSHFISKVRDSVMPNVIFNGSIIPYSSTVTNLGVTFDQHLSWAAHVDNISKKIFSSLHSLKRLQNFLPFNTKVMLAKSLLLPIIDYADVVFLDASVELVNRLERLQNMCIRFIFGLRKFDHISEFRLQLKWPTMQSRREMHILSFLYNILFNPAAPEYLRQRLQYQSDASGGRLRSADSLALGFPSHSSQTYTKSFTVHATRLWNSLPVSVRKSCSLAVFKVNLVKHFTQEEINMTKL